MIDEIEGGRLPEDYPIGESHTDEKLAHLKSSKKKLNSVVAPTAILITLMVAGRLLALSIARWKFPDEPLKWQSFFRPVDFIILISLFVLLVGLWIMHQTSLKSNENLSAMLRGWKAGKRASNNSPQKIATSQDNPNIKEITLPLSQPD